MQKIMGVLCFILAAMSFMHGINGEPIPIDPYVNAFMMFGIGLSFMTAE